VLLLISSDSLDEDDVSEQLSNRAGLIGAGLQFRTSPILVESIGEELNCFIEQIS